MSCKEMIDWCCPIRTFRPNTNDVKTPKIWVYSTMAVQRPLKPTVLSSSLSGPTEKERRDMTEEKQKNWENYPIRMITGWSAEWCELSAVLNDDGNIVEFNNSEDIVWFKHNRCDWHIDGGFYRDTYVVYFLVGLDTEKEKDWDDCIVAKETIKTPLEMIQCVERWMVSPPKSAIDWITHERKKEKA